MTGNRYLWIVFSCFVAALFFFGPVSTASAQSPDKAPATQEVDPNYVLGPEDVLTIIVRGIPEFSGDFMVTNDGMISFQIVGTLKVAGLKASEVQQKLTLGLRKELKDPQVTVNVKQMRPMRIYIQGAVNRAQNYDFKKGWRISELVAMAGGLNLPAERLKAIVFRQGSPTVIVDLKKIFVNGDDSADLALQAGDFVNIQPDPQVRVNVVGEVTQSGMKQIYEGQGAVEALAAAYGPTQKAALSRAKIVRAGKEIPVDLYAAVINADSTKNITVQDNDTLVIPQQYARVAVVGTVPRPGSQVMPDGRDWTISMAISEAGGMAPHAKGKVVLTRIMPDGKSTKSYDFSVSKLGTKGNPDMVLKDKDLLFIPQSGATQLQDLSSFATLYYVARALGL
jgi:polysaccharide export outer membrane protein